MENAIVYPCSENFLAEWILLDVSDGSKVEHVGAYEATARAGEQGQFIEYRSHKEIAFDGIWKLR